MGADARMPARVHPSWCPACHAPPGPDCPDAGKSGRQVRRREADKLRREAARAAEEMEER